jgi:hypothetical protein
MRVDISGSGRIGGNGGKLFARAGHEMLFNFSRDRAKLEALAEEANRVVAGLIEDPVYVGSLAGDVVWMEPPVARVRCTGRRSIRWRRARRLPGSRAAGPGVGHDPA